MAEPIRENEVSGAILDAAIKVHRTLGPGLLESVYEVALAYELRQRGHTVERQVMIPITYEGIVLDQGFRADLIVDDLVVIELKCVEQVIPVHRAQALTYTRMSGKRLGLLLNFGTTRLVDGVTRFANGLPE